MSQCNFSIEFAGTPEDILERAKKAIERQSGIFNGDINSGSFSINTFGTISGTYELLDQQLIINIEEKPIMIPCFAIENALKGLMEE